MPTHHLGSFFMASAFALLFGCAGKTVDSVSADSGAGAQQNSQDASQASDAAAADNELARAKAACDAPHGPLDSAMDADHVTATLVRRWYMCSSGDTHYYPLTPIELTADGHWYNLAVDAHGNFTRMQGIDNEGTWALGDDQGPVVNRTASSAISSVYKYTGTGMSGWMLAFEKEPVRFKGNIFTAGVDQWFVPIQ